jgi:PRC-barrel domain
LRKRWQPVFRVAPALVADRNKSRAGLFFILMQKEIHMATETKEIGNLIGSDKVEGTAVYGADNQKIGSIERVMIDKISGRVSYAVLGFGGFLGIGDDHYPLPWQSLKYDTGLGGYITGITLKQLEGAPKYGNDNSWNWADVSRTRAVNDYYGVGVI